MAVYWTSDTHFAHSNVLLYTKRPYSTVEEMNEGLVNNWNAKVKPEDTVYHLGDFAMGKREEIPKFRKQLNGRIIIILGNHDRGRQYMLNSGFDEVHRSMKLDFQGHKLFLHHQPIAETHWSNCDIALCGHVHTDWREIRDNEKRVINVGVDQWECTPQTFEELTAPRGFQILTNEDLE